MRRAPLVIITLLAFTAGYAAWPLYTALQIREALLAGDTATLERKIEWDSVRATLKASLSPAAAARIEADPEAPPPSLWQRIKASVAPRLASSAVDRYVTAENLPSFLGYRRVWRETVQPALGFSAPPTVLEGTFLQGSIIDRFASFWKRLRRGVIHSPSRITVEIEDARVPDRTYTGTLELRGWEWKLTTLTVSGAGF